jgi:hypothetical protein
MGRFRGDELFHGFKRLSPWAAVPTGIGSRRHLVPFPPRSVATREGRDWV